MRNRKKIFMEDNMCTIYKLILHKMQNILVKNGYEIANDPAESDLCLAGVCAAFNADEQRSIAIIDNMQRSTGKPIYVYGCMTQVNSTKINSPLQFASWRADYLIKKLINARQSSNGDIIRWYKEKLPNDFRTINDYRIYNPKKKFIGISTGCSFSCSYCPHKIGAGNIVSIPLNEIIEQIETINNEQIETIVLTGTDTACYGVDIGSSFSTLFANILRILKKSINIHIAQFNPEGIFKDYNNTNLFLDLFSDKRVADIQLPIQTVSQKLLKLMNRHYDLNELERFIKLLKIKHPKIMLRTDLMVGFPTETTDELDKAIEFACNNFTEIAVYSFEMKNVAPIYYMDFPLINQQEIERRRQYAVDKIKNSGQLVHSGGQRIATLMNNDKIKESLRR